MKRVYIMVGLPGSGKTTLAAKIKQVTPNPVLYISGDDLRVMLGMGEYLWDPDHIETKLLWLVSEFVSIFSGVQYDYILDEAMLSNTVHGRDRLIKKFGKDYKLTFVYCNTDKEICKERRRKDTKGYIPGTWDEVIERHTRELEPPKAEEFQGNVNLILGADV